MSNDNTDQQRLKHNDTGSHLGGTKFGQQPGTNGANPAKPHDKGKTSEHKPTDQSPSGEKDDG